MSPRVLADAADGPREVEVGVWLSGIHSIDVIDASFGAEFYLWWVADDPDFAPFDVFQVINGRDWTVRSLSQRRLQSGEYHTSGFVSVTVNHRWDLRAYPFDRQRLKVVLETPFPASELRLVPNRESSTVSRFVAVQGLVLEGFELEEHVEAYDTDFGFREGAGHQFSRVSLVIDLARQSRRLFVVTLIGFITANLIVLLTYTINVSTLAIRTTMISSAIFGAVGNMYFLTATVHPAAGSVLIDRVASSTFGAILVALLTGIVIDRIHQRARVKAALIVNWTVFGLTVLTLSCFYTWTLRAVL